MEELELKEVQEQREGRKGFALWHKQPVKENMDLNFGGRMYSESD